MAASAAERKRRQRERAAEKGLQEVTVVVPAGRVKEIREAARKLREDPG